MFTTTIWEMLGENLTFPLSREQTIGYNKLEKVQIKNRSFDIE